MSCCPTLLTAQSAIRWKAEQAAGIHPQGAIQMVAPLLQNLALTRGDNKELCYCLAAWNALPHALRTGQYPSKEEALQGAAVVDRIRNSLGRISDAISNRVEPIAIQLGRALAVEDWAIRLFHEEVVRGGPAFCLSQVLVPVERMLREAGELGTWQIIGPGAVSGTVVVEPELYAIQHNIYQQPTVLVVDRVGGEEEIPDGVVAVLTPDAPDVLSHVSVRARNMRCVFATCYDGEGIRVCCQVAAGSGVALIGCPC